MEELKLILETIEGLGNIGLNLFIIWIIKDMFKLIIISGVIYTIGKALISMFILMASGMKWVNECKNALYTKYGHKSWIEDYNDGLSPTSKRLIISAITDTPISTESKTKKKK